MVTYTQVYKEMIAARKSLLLLNDQYEKYMVARDYMAAINLCRVIAIGQRMYDNSCELLKLC